MRKASKIVLIVIVIASAIVLSVYFIGKDHQSIDKEYEAALLLEDQTTYPLKVRIRGALNQDNGEIWFNGGYHGGIFINEIKVLSAYPFHETEGDDMLLGSDSGVFYLSPDFDVFLGKIDAAMVNQDLDHQVGYVISTMDANEEYHLILQKLQNDERPVLQQP